MTREEEIAFKIGNHVVRRTNHSVMVNSPFRSDSDPSVEVTDNLRGQILLRDHGVDKAKNREEVERILQYSSLTWSDLFYGFQSKRKKHSIPERIAFGKRKQFGDGVRVTDMYQYPKADGSDNLTNVRLEGGKIQGKTFAWYQIDYATEEIKTGTKGAERVPYRLPELKKGIQENKDILFTEGEKDAETARKFGYVATTSSSATSWKPCLAKWFKDASIIFMPDNDEVGRQYVETVLKDLKLVIRRYKVVQTSTAPKGDLTDYIEEGHTKQDLEYLIQSVPWIDCKSAAVTTENNDSLVTVSEAIPVQLEYTHDGKPIQSIANFLEAIEHDQKINRLLRFNEFTMRSEIDGPAWWRRYEKGFTDADANELRMYIELTYGLRKADSFYAAVDIAARRHPFHPVKEWLESHTWSGEPRQGKIFQTFLGAVQSPYTEAVEKLFLFGAIARIYEPGIKFDSCPVLISRKQGSGKSTICRFLAGKDEYFTDSVLNLDSAKTVEALSGHWIAEIPEMMGAINARTVESIKSFLSRTQDTYRTPYARTPQTLLRQSVFIGTSNDETVLPADRTGNRRFLPIMCHPENAVVHPLKDEARTREFIKDALAESLILYRKGEYSLILPSDIEDEAEKARQDATPEDVLLGEVEEYLSGLPEGTRVCTKQVYYDGLGHDKDVDFPRDWELRQISKVLDGMDGWTRGPTNHRFDTYGRQRYWQCVNRTECAKESQLTNSHTVDTDFQDVVTEEGFIPFQ